MMEIDSLEAVKVVKTRELTPKVVKIKAVKDETRRWPGFS
jgi:hypothetical protein